MLRVTVLVSGGGTNLQAIIDAIRDLRIKNAKIERVISNNPGAYALTRARDAGIETAVVSPKEFADRTQFNEALLKAIDESKPDLVVLAGFMVVLPESVIKSYPGKIINIHPSLIPSFCGKGYYGLRVHEEVLKRGVKVTGATVHFVDEGTDTGPIIMQKAVDVHDDDTPETLQRRVMEEAEWNIMPRVIELIARGCVRIENGRTYISQ